MSQSGSSDGCATSSDEGSTLMPIREYAQETRNVALALQQFSQSFASECLANVAIETANQVVTTIEEVDQSTRTIISALNKENQLLREELLRCVHSGAENLSLAVALGDERHAPVVQHSNNVSYTDGTDVTRDSAHYLESLNVMSTAIRQLTEENYILRQEQANSVSVVLHRQLQERCWQLESELNDKNSKLAAVTIELDALIEVNRRNHSEKLREATNTSAIASEDDLKHPTSKGTSASSWGQLQHVGLWTDAIREVEELATVLANERTQRAELESQLSMLDRLRCDRETLQAKLESGDALLAALGHDYELAKQHIEAMEAQITTLFERNHQLETTVQLITTEKRGAGESIVARRLTETDDSLNSSTSTTFASYRAPPSLDISLFKGQAKQHRSLANLVPTPKHFSEDSFAVQLNHSFGGKRFEDDMKSPPPVAPPYTTAPLESKIKDKFLATSVDQLVKKQQSLIAENLQLRADREELSNKLQRCNVLGLVEPIDDERPAKRGREDDAIAASVTTVRVRRDVGTITDCVEELLSWHSAATCTAPPSTVVGKESPTAPAIEQVVTATNHFDARCLAIAAGTAGSVLKTLHEAEAIVGGYQSSLGQFMTSHLDCMMEVDRLENKLQLTQAAFEEAVDELSVRDAVGLGNTMALPQLVEQAIERQNLSTSRLPLSNTSDIVELQPIMQQVDRFVSVMKTVTDKEDALCKLVRQAPQRAHFVRSVIVPHELQIKLDEAERVIDELQAQLSHERQRCGALISSVDNEKRKQLEFMDRVWQAEQAALESQHAMEEMRNNEGRMMTREEYGQLESQLNNLQSELEASQAHIHHLEDSLERKGKAHEASAAALKTALEKKTCEYDGLMRDLHTLKHANEDFLKAIQHLESSMITMRSREVELIGQLNDTTAVLQEKILLLDELRHSLLAQECTESLLRTLFPGDSSLDGILVRSKQLFQANQELHAAVGAASLEHSSLQRTIEELNQALLVALQQRQCAEVELESLRSQTLFATKEGDSARLRIELEGCHCELAQTRKERDNLREREKELLSKVEALSNDPVSLNTRKYGIAMTKTLQEQVDLVHAETERLRAELAAAKQRGDEGEADIVQLKRVVAECEEHKLLLNQQISELKATENQLRSSIVGLNADNASLADQLSQEKKAKEASQQHGQELRAELMAAQEAVRLSEKELDQVKSSLDKLFGDYNSLGEVAESLTTELQRKGNALLESQQQTRQAEAAAAAANLALQQRSHAVANAPLHHSTVSSSQRFSAPTFAEAAKPLSVVRNRL